MNSIPRAKPKAVARRPRQSNTPPVSKDVQQTAAQAKPVPSNVKSLEINKSTGPSLVPPRNVVGKMSTAPRAQAQPPSKRIGVQVPPNPLSVIPKEEKKVRKKFFNLHLTNGMFLFKVEVEVMYPQRMDNLASINDTKSFTFKGTGFSQDSPLEDLGSVKEALEALCNFAAITHR